MELRLAGIVKESVVDGPGFRYVIFTQGCIHKCKGCHNPDTHDLGGGYNADADEIIEEIMKSKYIDGVTFSGGDPFLQADACAYIAEKIKAKNIHIVSYTGFTIEQLLKNGESGQKKLLALSDMLIDGPYLEEQKDLGLTYRGSRNQRVLDVQESLRINAAVAAKLYRAVS